MSTSRRDGRPHVARGRGVRRFISFILYKYANKNNRGGVKAYSRCNSVDEANLCCCVAMKDLLPQSQMSAG